jgi:AcrR family transcriptional regulator
MSKNSKRKQTEVAGKLARTKGESSRRAKHPGNRYVRSEEARQAVLEAADNLLVKRGFAALTIEGIAARAGVGKQTIYRWWPSKTDVLLDAFLEDAVQHLKPQDSGDLGRDLRAHLRNLAEFLARSDAGAVFRALTAQAQHDAHLRRGFGKTIWRSSARWTASHCSAPS